MIFLPFSLKLLSQLFYHPILLFHQLLSILELVLHCFLSELYFIQLSPNGFIVG